MSSPDELERFKGCLLGLAIGDALGTTLQFKSRGSFDPITEMNSLIRVSCRKNPDSVL